MDISIIRTILAYLFVFILLIIIKYIGVSKQKLIFTASIRMSIQLILAGLFLKWIFQNNSPLAAIVILIVMEVFASVNIYRMLKKDIRQKVKIFAAMCFSIGTIFCILYAIFIVINVSPWYDLKYFITISGMIIGNSMAGIILCVNRFSDDMKNKKDEIEAALMLGSKPKLAVKEIVRDSFEASLTPTLNSMIGMGIVFLPGMMTGQIISGQDPNIAIKYQIVIILCILGGVTLTVFLFLQFGIKVFLSNSQIEK